MAPSIAPSILRALSLDANSTTVAVHGSSGFTSTYRLSVTTTTTTTPTATSAYSAASVVFVKTAPGAAARTMFAGEHASLNAIHAVGPTLCPRALGWGKLDDDDNGKDHVYFLATEFLELGARRSRVATKDGSGSGSGLSLAQKLAALHMAPAPLSDSHGGGGGGDGQIFGFPVTTCCGETPQDNTWTASWADFFAERRLRAILEQGERNHGRSENSELRRLVERTAAYVVPRLLAPDHLGGSEGIKPALVHGDLWSGNRGSGTFVGRSNDKEGGGGGGGGGGGETVEEVVFDPSACYAHSEYELGIMQMFGGFGGGFMTEYHDLVPKTEPVEEYEDRVRLYESYHHLNHWAMFGGGYRSGATGILKALCRKYADGEDG